MNTFLIGVISSVTAAIILVICSKYIWPLIQDKVVYEGVRIDGTWNIVENRNGNNVTVG